MSTNTRPSYSAAMPHATANTSPPARPPGAAADAARRPAPIQTFKLYTTHLPQPKARQGAQAEGDDTVLERPPISPITPTEEDGPASLPAPPPTQPPAAHAQDHSRRSPPISLVPFSLIAQSQHKTSPQQPPSQHFGSHPSRATASTDSSGVTPPRPPSSASQQTYHFSSGGSSGGAHTTLERAARARPSAIPPATFMPRPPAQPLDEASNTDVAALKACISVLQLQQAKSRKDIATLQRLKEGAAADPTGFAIALQSGSLDDGAAVADPLAATFAGADDESEDEEMQDADAGGDSKFGTIPRPQNVVRCPPINWSKYHIVGESLDRMHEDQRRRPDPGEPWRDGPREAVVFAPYSPFKDQLGPHQQGMVTRKGGKRPG